jgi:hypothetical protein
MELLTDLETLIRSPTESLERLSTNVEYLFPGGHGLTLSNFTYGCSKIWDVCRNGLNTAVTAVYLRCATVTLE